MKDRMKEWRLPYREIVRMPYGEVGRFVLNLQLKAAGFDLTKEILMEDDRINYEYVYRQKL